MKTTGKPLTEQGILGRLRDGQKLKYVSLSAGYVFSDGSPVGVNIIRGLARRMLVKIEGELVCISSPEEYAAKRQRVQDERASNRSKWLTYWRQSVQDASDAAAKESAIERLIGWAQNHELTEEFNTD